MPVLTRVQRCAGAAGAGNGDGEADREASAGPASVPGLLRPDGVQRLVGMPDTREASKAMSALDDGLTSEEREALDALVVAANIFGKLERQHPDELRDFVDGIHRCQYLLAMRVARRAFPIGWPVIL